MNLQSIELNQEAYPILFQDKNLGKQKYSHVTTMNPVKVLMDAGWLPRQVVSIKPRKEEKKGFQKHRVRFFNPNLPQVNGSVVELLLTNSYDATSSFVLQLGIFRMVCENGILVGDTFSQENVRHVGYSEQKVFDSICKLLPQTETILSAVDRFSSIELEEREKTIFGQSILDMRLSEEKGWIVDDYAIGNLYQTRRYADNKKDLWTVFNRAQENLCRFGFYASKKNDDGYIERNKVRAVKNTFRADPLNKALWTLSETMYALLKKKS